MADRYSAGKGVKGSIVRESVEGSLRAFKSLDFYLVLLGLALCRAWLVLCLTHPLIMGNAETSDLLYLIPGCLAGFVIGFFAYRSTDRRRFDRIIKILTGVIIVFCLVAYSPVLASGNALLIKILLISGGIGAASLQIMWGVGFAQRELLFTLFCYPASAIATAVLVIAALNDGGLLAFSLYPLISFVLLLVAHTRASCHEEERSTDTEEQAIGEDGAIKNEQAVYREKEQVESSEKPLALHVVIRLLVSIVIFSFLCRLFDSLPVGAAPDPFESWGGSSLFAIIVNGVLFLLLVMVLGKVFNPLSVYRISLPLMALGMAVIALFFSDHWYVSILIIGVGYELFDTLSWILLVALAQNLKNRFSSYVMFGFGIAATTLGMSLAYSIGGVVYQQLVYGGIQISSIGIISVLVVLITSLLVLPEGAFVQILDKRGGERQKVSEKVAPVENPLLTACDLVSEEYRLTRREGEVLVMLARGRTLAIIMRDLYIAKGTAQTHIENVYQKLNVHKQQELIDMVESYIEDGSWVK